MLKGQVIGLQEAQRRFHRLEDAVASKVLRRAVARAATPIRAEARRLVPKRTGRLRKAIGLRTRSFGRYRAEASIGFRRKMAKYGGWVELGHRLVRGRKKAQKRVIGHVPARPYLRPALETKAREAEDRMREALRSSIEKALRGRR